MTRIVLALTFPLRYYAYLTAFERDRVAAAPLNAETGGQDRLAA
jgi:hypothetical protein